MSEFLFKSYSRSTETSFFPWKSRKFENSIFFKMVDFSLFFAICILYLHFVFRVCLFVFFPFWLLVFCCWSPWSRERLISNSRVVIDHQNRHHHHQMSIRTQTRTETSLGVLHANTRHKYANTQRQRRSIEHDHVIRRLSQLFGMSPISKTWAKWLQILPNARDLQILSKLNSSLRTLKSIRGELVSPLFSSASVTTIAWTLDFGLSAQMCCYPL